MASLIKEFRMSRLTRQIIHMARPPVTKPIMSEEVWLNGNDTQRMHSYLADGTEAYQFVRGYSKERVQHFIDACYNICTCFPEDDTYHDKKNIAIAEWSRLSRSRSVCLLSSKIKAHLLREIFANPFRPIVRECEYLRDPAVHSRVYHCARDLLTCQTTDDMRWEHKQILSTFIFKESWITRDITSFSQEMYKKQDFSGLPILWDMLEEQHCNNQEVMRHCKGLIPYFDAYGKIDEYRQAPPDYKYMNSHVRGCWLIELLRGVR